jgi:hypothetical protein
LSPGGNSILLHLQGRTQPFPLCSGNIYVANFWEKKRIRCKRKTQRRRGWREVEEEEKGIVKEQEENNIMEMKGEVVRTKE